MLMSPPNIYKCFWIQSCCSDFTLLGLCALASQQTHSETASNHIEPRFAELASRFQEHLASTVFNSSFLDRYGYSAIYPMFILVVYKLTNARDSRIRRCDPGDETHYLEIFLEAVGGENIIKQFILYDAKA